MALTGFLEPEFLRKLERLNLVARKVYQGRLHGERRSAKRGHSVEFADYREYAPGDDPRYVDWKAYGRLDKLFVKLFREDQDLSVHLLIDTSASMGFGESITKRQYAQRVAAALGFVGLREFDRMTVSAFADGLKERMPALRGEINVPRFLQFLDGISDSPGPSGFGKALRAYAERESSSGLAVVISDFLDPTYSVGIKALLARRYQVVLIHVLDAEEVEPTVTGDVRLIDSENGDGFEVTVSEPTLIEYRKAFNAFCADITNLSRRFDIDYVRITTDIPFEDVVLKYLTKGGLLR